jgi:hypothetical protein
LCGHSFGSAVYSIYFRQLTGTEKWRSARVRTIFWLTSSVSTQMTSFSILTFWLSLRVSRNTTHTAFPSSKPPKSSRYLRVSIILHNLQISLRLSEQSPWMPSERRSLKFLFFFPW